jgi:hypothetical protein
MGCHGMEWKRVPASPPSSRKTQRVIELLASEILSLWKSWPHAGLMTGMAWHAKGRIQRVSTDTHVVN